MKLRKVKATMAVALFLLMVNIQMVTAAQLVTVRPFHTWPLPYLSAWWANLGAPSVVTVRINNIEPNGWPCTVIIYNQDMTKILHIAKYVYEGESTTYYNEDFLPLRLYIVNPNEVTIEIWGEVVRRWDP